MCSVHSNVFHKLCNDLSPVCVCVCACAFHLRFNNSSSFAADTQTHTLYKNYASVLISIENFRSSTLFALPLIGLVELQTIKRYLREREKKKKKQKISSQLSMETRRIARKIKCKIFGSLSLANYIQHLLDNLEHWAFPISKPREKEVVIDQPHPQQTTCSCSSPSSFSDFSLRCMCVSSIFIV